MIYVDINMNLKEMDVWKRTKGKGMARVVESEHKKREKKR
jgi:hypothetical protein